MSEKCQQATCGQRGGSRQRIDKDDGVLGREDPPFVHLSPFRAVKRKAVSIQLRADDGGAAANQLSVHRRRQASQFFLPPSCNACNAFSMLSEPETWLGG